MTNADQASATEVHYGDEIVAPADNYHRGKFILMSLGLIGFGLWFAYDGYIGWPKHNEQVRTVQRQIDDADRVKDEATASRLRVELSNMDGIHNNAALLLQKVLGWSLPPIGLALLIRTLYNSRGVYRLAGQTLHVPGHPPVPFDAIRRIDKRLWDRKGIAFVDYELDGGAGAGAAAKAGRLKLDDFVYKRDPTDAIFKRIENFVSPPAESADASRLSESA